MLLFFFFIKKRAEGRGGRVREDRKDVRMCMATEKEEGIDMGGGVGGKKEVAKRASDEYRLRQG